MKAFHLKHSFARVAAYAALTLSLLGPMISAQKQSQGRSPSKPKSTMIVTWGDSIGNAVGQSISSKYPGLINKGKDGSGLTIANLAEPLNNVPAGAVVLMSIGTNDVGTFIGASDKAIAKYASKVMAVCDHVIEQGAKPILIGMQAPTGPYTGSPKIWNQPGYLVRWIKTMHRINAAIAKAAKGKGIAYSKVQGRVSERKSDHLHYTTLGSRKIANNALRDAGIKR